MELTSTDGRVSEERHDASLDDSLAMEARMNAEAFAPLYERHTVSVYRYLRARGATETDAAELTAVTFERAMRHIDRYRPGGSGFAPWLFRIARNASIDASRRAHTRWVDLDRLSHLVAPGPSPEETAIANEERRWILGVVARLPSIQRDVLALRFAAGLSGREIAAVVGKSEAATRKILSRSLATLQEAAGHDE